jgi:uncharacterized membrane protein required for colicin V production
MIAAVTSSSSSWAADHLPFNWFDVALVLVLAFGLFRGRKNGMSKEIFPFFQWFFVMLAAGLAYPLLTNILVNSAGLRRNTGTLILSYLVIVAVVLFVFSMIRHSLKSKTGGSSFFGGGEYYLGMISGIIRYGCIAILFLAVLNAPVYTAAEIQAQKEYNNRWFGGGEAGYSGDYIPSVASIQEAVFRRSFVGPYIHSFLAPVLINPQNGGGLPPAKAPIIHMGS